MKLLKKIKNKVKEKGLLFTIIYSINSTIYFFLSKIVYSIAKKKRLKNIFVFYSLPDFSDNAKELYNYYINNNDYKDYKFIWMVSKPKKFKKQKMQRTIFIKDVSKLHTGKTLKALWYTTISKTMFYTHMCPLTSLKKYKRNGQLVINLWHGCGYKKIESKTLKKRKEVLFDYVLVPGQVFIKTKSEFFRCNQSQILDIGYPRYDLLKKENKNTFDYVKKLKKDGKLILWMPTFRKTNKGYYPEEQIENTFDLPLLNSKEELDELNTICKEKKINLCIKRHPMQTEYECESEKFSNIEFIDNDTLAKENIDLYSLLKYTDGLITDYSSVAIDYILLDKPIGFTLDDFEKYSETRGFVFENPKDYMPGHHIYNFNDMKQYIEDIGNNKDQYKENRKSIMNEVHNPCRNYCERIVKKVEKLKEEI